jgi:hypothetical protein
MLMTQINLPTFTFKWVERWRRGIVEIRKGFVAGEEKFFKREDHSIGEGVAKGVRSGGHHSIRVSWLKRGLSVRT